MDASFAALDSALFNHVRIDAATLDRLARDHSPAAPVLLHLVQLAESDQPRMQIAATGLLKRYQERGAPFSDELVARLLDLLPTASHWEVTLHLLQMLAQLSIPPTHADSLCDLLRDLLRHRNAFVRAWAYSALHHLATLQPEYRSDVAPLLDRAAQAEVASVRARLRQLPPLGTGSLNA